ncbi:MAG: diaminopimelate epimerase [Actinomycetota bacterium]|jgi:diaminopimelate epimerase|nr:diaminopimelate epimerase [Actinomycetota bacterium]
MKLEKYHGLGNDFLVLLDLDGVQPVDGATARALCDRHRGVGADGLIRVTAGTAPALVTMELYNADGGRAEMSGNGIRCLALALVDAGLATGPEITIATDAGPRRVVVGTNGAISVDMGVATVEAGPGPALHVDMGNPHAVLEVQDPYDEDLGREFRRQGANVNVEVVSAGPGPDELTMRVWERGVGETLACGTGACAAAVAGHKWGMVGERVTVHQPGGDVTVDLGGEQIVLTGPATWVATVEVRTG